MSELQLMKRDSVSRLTARVGEASLGELCAMCNLEPGGAAAHLWTHEVKLAAATASAHTFAQPAPHGSGSSLAHSVGSNISMFVTRCCTTFTDHEK